MSDLIFEKISNLRKRIHQYNIAYYHASESLVSDFEYDALLKELEDLEAKYPEFDSPNSPSKRVAGQVSKEFTTVHHKKAMLSLANTYSAAELNDFVQRVYKGIADSQVDFFVELKIDGVACSLIYDKGELQRAVTRGDGSKGDDITANICCIASIPLYINDKSFLEVRGEVYFTHENFNRLNQKRSENAEDLFANPRNAASGTLKLLDSSIVASRNLSFFAYYVDKEVQPFITHADSIEWLRNNDFPVENHSKICRNMSELMAYCDFWERERLTLPFDIDGAVVKVNQIAWQKLLGQTAKIPRWAIAYKFKAEQVETTILDVSWQLGRTGALTPVAELSAVELAGTIVKRATLHNVEEFKRKNLFYNDCVLIEKGGDIIPKVLSVNLQKRRQDAIPFPIPSHCPFCQEILEKLEEDAHLRCLNLQCPEQKFRKMEHFVSKTAMDIDGMGPAIIELLLKKQLINDFPDIYLKLNSENLMQLERMGKKSAENLIIAIEQSKQRPFAHVLYALGIRFVGINTAKLIVNKLKNLETIISANANDLAQIEGVGDRIAESIVQYLRNPSHIDMIEQLKAIGLQFSDRVIAQKSSGILSGKTIVLTGTLSQFSRDKAAELCEQNGAKITGSVSAKTSILIAGENAGSKLDKAKELNIEIWNEDDLLRVLKIN